MRPLLRAAGLALPVFLSACGGGSSSPDLYGVRGSTVQAIRGEAAPEAPLQPESGNIWGEGLTSAAPAP